jgi:ParB-like chromosome segregation protein Spo0J
MRVMMLDLISEWCDRLKQMPLAQQVEELNAARRMMHDAGPFSREPVDCIEWVHTDGITANDYNPNSVAPPEMELLKLSILEDGYTQPIVSWKKDGVREVVDGFHRNRIGRECMEVRHRIRGYLPLTTINTDREDRGDRIASTIRHNRARGKHAVTAMSDIVIELKRRNWSDEKIARELGMDQDEILRLCQISGLAELFADQEFSKSWDVEGSVTEADFRELTDDVQSYSESETASFRTVNTSDEGRIFHTYDKWECHKAGFYATTKDGMSKAQCEEAMRGLLADIPAFRKALRGVVTNWNHSCEHYLTNGAMNRIAWLGQAAACYAMGIPAVYRGGFYLLTSDQQAAANKAALTYLNKWLKGSGRQPVDMDTAAPDREMEIY